MTTADKFRRELPVGTDKGEVRRRIREGIDRQESGCWIWTKSKNASGYGEMVVGGQRWIVTRLIWMLEYGSIPFKHYICHKCDTPACMNPEHLFVGTMSDNIQDSLKKGRNYHATRIDCDRGHPLSGDNLYMKPDGSRACRTCHRGRERIVRLGWPEHLAYSTPAVPADARNNYKRKQT